MARKIVRARPADRNVTIRKANVTLGNVAKVAVQIDNSDGAAGFDLFFQYDQTLLTKPRLVLGTALFQRGWHIISDSANPGEVNCCLYEDQDIALPAGVSTIAELHFDLMPKATVGDVASISFNHLRVKGLKVVGIDGSVTVV